MPTEGQPVLYGPQRSPNFPKRNAELDFIWKVQAAVLDVTGKMPPRTAHRDKPGPFALMVQECFQLMGAEDASAVDLINELNRRARGWERARADRPRALPNER